MDCFELKNNLKKAEAHSLGIVGLVKKAKKKKGTLVNHSQKKILGYAWRKMWDQIKVKVVGWLVLHWTNYPLRVLKVFVWVGSCLSPNQFVRRWALVLLRVTWV